MNPHTLPDELPLFPLAGALLLPRGRLPLQIFEPRYLAMFEDCLKSETRMLGLIQPEDSNALTEAGQSQPRIGSAGRIVGFSETNDGRYMITLSGVSRFQISEVHEGFKPYSTASVDWRGFEDDLGAIETDSTLNRDEFLPRLIKFFKLHDLETDWESLADAEDELLINSLAMLCPFEPKEKQALLEARTLSTRRKILQKLIEFALHQTPQKDQIQ
jgi:Lon protease-like protein